MQHLLPVVEIAVAGLLILLLLPSALRPPNQHPPGTPQLSPDTPPNDDQQAIIASLNRASTGVGGAGDAQGGSGANLGATNGDLPADVKPPANRPPRACPYGFGDPPRQVESVYAPPCAPAFVGDNGGETAYGVTGSEIRVAIAATGQSHTRPMPDQGQSGETVQERALRAYVQYINSHFQLYGRKLSVYQFKWAVDDSQAAYAGGTDTGARDAAATWVDTAHPFASIVLGGGPSMYDEFARRKVISMGPTNYQPSWLIARQPYPWSFYMDAQGLGNLGAEYLCKKLYKKPAVFAGDDEDPSRLQNFKSQTRKFGWIRINTPLVPTNDADETLPQKLARMCGMKFEDGAIVEYDPLGADRGAQAIQTGIAKLKSMGITSVLFTGDYFYGGVQSTTQATRDQYWPEWVILGQAGTDINSFARYEETTQWAHAFGITANEFTRPKAETDWYKAFREMDQGSEPVAGSQANNFADYSGIYFPALMLLAKGIQAAGPNLSVETFRDGLIRLGHRQSDPFWSLSGGFGPGDYTFAEDVVEIWWDPAGKDPNDATRAGAYEFTKGGKRYKEGEWDSDISSLFREGSTQAPFS